MQHQILLHDAEMEPNMLIKLAGGIMVIAASGFIGYILSRDCAIRPQELRDLQGLMQMFENEVCYMSNLLSDAFYNISKASSSKVAVFFRSASELLKKDVGINASEAWEQAVRSNIVKTSLSKEDEEILINFGKILGSSDIDGQVMNIKLTINHLKLQERKAEEARKKNEKMYKNLGLLCGLAIVIILL